VHGFADLQVLVASSQYRRLSDVAMAPDITVPLAPVFVLSEHTP
jgi:hypothetical protein